MPVPQSRLQKYSAPALEKGLDILEWLSIADTEMSLSQIAAGIGRSRNEIFRMMIVLEERGFVGRTSGDQYHLTDRLSLLGSARSVHNRLAELATPVLSRLSERTALSCHLSILDGDSVVVIAQAEAVGGYAIAMKIGHRTDAGQGSARVCLVETVRSGVVGAREGKNAGQPFTGNDGGRAEPNVIEMSGAAQSGITELSVRVLDLSGRRAVAAITIPFLTATVNDDRKTALIPPLRDAAELLQRQIDILLPQL